MNVVRFPTVYLDGSGPTRRDRVEAQRRAMGWGGSYAIAVRPEGCPECGGTITTQSTGQLALFRHGGYGATVTTVRRWCPTCGFDAGTHRTETNPRGAA